MPDRVIRWRAPGGKSGTIPASKSGQKPARKRPVRAAQPAESADRRALRTRYGLSPGVSDDDLFATVAAAMSQVSPSSARDVAPRVPLVSDEGPTREQLAVEADWEETNNRLFGLPPGPATAAAAAAGLPTIAQRRSDAYGNAQQAWLAEFHRNAAAADASQVASIDAARNAAVAASSESHDRSHERLHWPELGR